MRGVGNGGDGVSREVARGRIEFGSLEMVVRGGVWKVAEGRGSARDRDLDE